MWFSTIDAFTRIPVFITKLSERQHHWRVLEDFHCQEYTQFLDIHICLFMRLHFSIGSHDYRRTTLLRQSIHLSITQVLFRWSCALTLRSRQQILVPQVLELMQAGAGATLMQFTWTNVTEQGSWVSNFGMKCNSLCELYTLDRLRHVGALPENRLLRRHVPKYATQLSCIRKLTFG